MRKCTHHTETTRKLLSKKAKKQWKEGRANPDSCYQKGNKAWNKGLSIHLSPKSEFKEGENVGEKHPSWKGGVQKVKNDCVHLWAGANKRVRRPKVIYEKNFGKVPKGYVVYHLDGDKDNDEPSNLVAISRAELLRLNREKRSLRASSTFMRGVET
jgi:hypothetical protein